MNKLSASFNSLKWIVPCEWDFTLIRVCVTVNNFGHRVSSNIQNVNIAYLFNHPNAALLVKN